MDTNKELIEIVWEVLNKLGVKPNVPFKIKGQKGWYKISEDCTPLWGMIISQNGWIIEKDLLKILLDATIKATDIEENNCDQNFIRSFGENNFCENFDWMNGAGYEAPNKYFTFYITLNNGKTLTCVSDDKKQLIEEYKNSPMNSVWKIKEKNT